MPLDPRTTRSSLKRKGFIEAEGDHHFYLFYHQGKIIAKTKVSHNNQEIADFLISKMRKQCRLTKKQFIDLIDCPLSQEDYINILKQQGLIN